MVEKGRSFFEFWGTVAGPLELSDSQSRAMHFNKNAATLGFRRMDAVE
jgi:hypothetical protein